MKSEYSLGDLLRYLLRLGALGFGGPIALVGHMQRDLVERRRWFTKSEFDEGVALAQLAPGPLAAQLAIYLGWVKADVVGATLAGVAFILPSFFIVLGLSALYVRYQGLNWIQGAFYGVGAAVIAIIALSAFRLVKKTVNTDRLLQLICAVSAGITVVTESEILWVFLLAGFLCVLVRKVNPPTTRLASLFPLWAVTGLFGAQEIETLSRLFLYFAKAGAFVFGSGLAIVPFLHGGVVQEYRWLTERQFLDAVAVAMITPGPVVITVAFIGYLVAGPVGAALAALGVFLPCYLFVILPAPYFNRFAKKNGVRAFVDGVTAAAIGAIAGAGIVLGRRALIDGTSVVICVAVLCALLLKRKMPEPILILAAAILGVILKP